MAELHVSISAETIATVAGFEITNSMFTGFLASLIFLVFIYKFKQKKLQTKRIGYFQNIVELLVETLYKLCKDVAGDKRAKDFFPLIATAIFFILINNWFGLLPGVHTIGVSEPIHLLQTPQAQAATNFTAMETETEGYHFIPILRASTADLNGTLALALISVVMTQYYGVKYLGFGYFTKFFNFKDGPIFTAVGFLELVSELSKIVSFAFRLFGNIFAGEVLLVVIAALVPLLAPVPFLGLELFVGFIQALVFTMLTLVFINMATHSH